MNYIYLLKEREFVKTGEDIFKIGRSCQTNIKRVYQYPKGSVLIFQSVCNNCIILEKKIKDTFIKIFKQRKDIGCEYFEGSFVSMINIIYELLKEDYKTTINIFPPVSKTMTQEFIKEKEQQINEFLENYDIIEKVEYLKQNKLEKIKFRVKGNIVYHEYLNWCKCKNLEPIGIKLFNKLIRTKIDEVKISGVKFYLCKSKIPLSNYESWKIENDEYNDMLEYAIKTGQIDIKK